MDLEGLWHLEKTIGERIMSLGLWVLLQYVYKFLHILPNNFNLLWNACIICAELVDIVPEEHWPCSEAYGSWVLTWPCAPAKGSYISLPPLCHIFSLLSLPNMSRAFQSNFYFFQRVWSLGLGFFCFSIQCWLQRLGQLLNSWKEKWWSGFWFLVYFGVLVVSLLFGLTMVLTVDWLSTESTTKILHSTYLVTTNDIFVCCLR